MLIAAISVSQTLIVSFQIHRISSGETKMEWTEINMTVLGSLIGQNFIVFLLRPSFFEADSHLHTPNILP